MWRRDCGEGIGPSLALFTTDAEHKATQTIDRIRRKRQRLRSNRSIEE
jgi:hypothetical protein